MTRQVISEKVKQQLLEESRYQCPICGSKGFLQFAYITALAEGRGHTPENMMVLCPTCHMAVDSARISASALLEIKRDWIEKRILGRERIWSVVQNLGNALDNSSIERPRSLQDLVSWSEALRKSEEFDASVKAIVQELSGVKSEDVFITDVLKPLFDALGYEGVTCLHHTGRAEHGKDIVFYERERLGGFTFYAIVACVGKVHATSSKAQDSGHYTKIIDQINKCFELPYTDYNLKNDFYVDKVIIACSDSITEEALKLLRSWEDKHRRRLVFMDAAHIAGHKLRMNQK